MCFRRISAGRTDSVLRPICNSLLAVDCEGNKQKGRGISGLGGGMTRDSISSRSSWATVEDILSEVI